MAWGTRAVYLSRSIVPLCLLLVLAGCQRLPKGQEPDKIVATTPETQLGLCGASLTNCIRVELLATPMPCLLGGKSKAQPIAGVKLSAKPADEASGMVVWPAEVVTDAGGAAHFSVKLGQRFGDQYLVVCCSDQPEIKKRLRFVAGAQIENDRQEIGAGSMLPNPFRVRIVDNNANPIVGLPVFFTLSKQPGESGSLTRSLTQTDTNGVAETVLRSDRRATGRYDIRVDVSDQERGIFIRPFFGSAIALSPTGIILKVLGGLAIFIFGITLMSEGLQQMAGSKMKAVLAYIIRNRVTAILAGTFVTALIQSSIATTVMTVGFVNAGLLTLRQAIGVVLGANIGTTVTGQIIAFKLDGLAQPVMIIGVVMLVLARKGFMQGAARSVMGFGLLFFGMRLMTTELNSISSFPTFVRFFHLFDCSPVDGNGIMPLTSVLGAVGIGIVLTILVQSSAAMIGLTIALANSGLISIWTAIPIVLGDNIGTTMTALLASVNANRTARQTAMAHSMFNVLGTIIVICSFYYLVDGVPVFLHIVNLTASGDVFNGENIGRHVAMGHSLFNVINVLLMTPFIGVLAWLCERILPGRNVTSRTVYLEKNLLNSPPLALFCAMRALGDMTETAWSAAAASLQGYKSANPADLDEIQRIEDEVDDRQSAIMDYLVQLTRKDLNEKQAGAIPVMMHCVNDAERISDLALLIAKRAISQTSISSCLSEAAHQELDVLLEKTTIIANLTRESLQDGRMLAKAVDVVVKDLRTLTKTSMQRHVNRIQAGLCTAERGLVYVEVIGAIESIVRHLGNIAERSDQLTEAAL